MLSQIPTYRQTHELLHGFINRSGRKTHNFLIPIWSKLILDSREVVRPSRAVYQLVFRGGIVPVFESDAPFVAPRHSAALIDS